MASSIKGKLFETYGFPLFEHKQVLGSKGAAESSVSADTSLFSGDTQQAVKEVYAVQGIQMGKREYEDEIERISYAEWLGHILGFPMRRYMVGDGEGNVNLTHPSFLELIPQTVRNIFNYRPNQSAVGKVLRGVVSLPVNVVAVPVTFARNVFSLAELLVSTVRDVAWALFPITKKENFGGVKEAFGVNNVLWNALAALLSAPAAILGYKPGPVTWLATVGLTGVVGLFSAIVLSVAAPLVFLSRAISRPIDAINGFNAWGTVWGDRLAMLSRATTLLAYTAAAVGLVLGAGFLLSLGLPAVTAITGSLAVAAVTAAPVTSALSIALGSALGVTQMALTYLGLNVAASFVLAGISGFAVAAGVVLAGPAVNQLIEDNLNADRAFAFAAPTSSSATTSATTAAAVDLDVEGGTITQIFSALYPERAINAIGDAQAFLGSLVSKANSTKPQGQGKGVGETIVDDLDLTPGTGTVGGPGLKKAGGYDGE